MLPLGIRKDLLYTRNAAHTDDPEPLKGRFLILSTLLVPTICDQTILTTS